MQSEVVKRAELPVSLHERTTTCSICLSTLHVPTRKEHANKPCSIIDQCGHRFCAQECMSQLIEHSRKQHQQLLCPCCRCTVESITHWSYKDRSTLTKTTQIIEQPCAVHHGGVNRNRDRDYIIAIDTNDFVTLMRELDQTIESVNAMLRQTLPPLPRQVTQEQSSHAPNPPSTTVSEVPQINSGDFREALFQLMFTEALRNGSA